MVPQYAFDCEPSIPGPFPGSISAMCCSASELLPDGEGSFRAAQGCWGTYHGANYEEWSLGWIVDRVADETLQRLGLQEGSSHGWSMQGNCGSGFDGVRGVCCKNAPTRSQLRAGESWTSECLPRPFSRDTNFDVLKTKTAFLCKTVDTESRSSDRQMAVCCPPSTHIISDDTEKTYHVNTPGCTYALGGGWPWRLLGNDETVAIASMNDCGSLGNGYTALCCKDVSYSKPNGIADAAGDCIFASV